MSFGSREVLKNGKKKDGKKGRRTVSSEGCRERGAKRTARGHHWYNHCSTFAQTEKEAYRDTVRDTMSERVKDYTRLSPEIRGRAMSTATQQHSASC